MPRGTRVPASGAYVIVDNVADPGTYRFAPRFAPNLIPADQKKVIAAATDHYANVLEYIERQSDQNEWLDSLKQIVSVGAVQQEVDPIGACEQIKAREKLLKDKLVPFLAPARNRLIWAAVVVFAIASAIGIGIRIAPLGDELNIDPVRISNHAFAVAWSMPALIIQYLVAIRYVTPKTYAELKSDLSNPVLETLACAIMCVIVVALLATGAIAINIKGLETKDVELNTRTAVVVGIICGLASRRLGPVLLGLGAKLASRLK